jgi:hypothetical protein
MVKSLAAFAIFTLLGTAVIALPGVAPKVEARETLALAKGDRLDVRPTIGIAQSRFGQPLRLGVSRTQMDNRVFKRLVW